MKNHEIQTIAAPYTRPQPEVFGGSREPLFKKVPWSPKAKYKEIQTMRLKPGTAPHLIDANPRIKEKNYWLQKLSGDLMKSAFPYDRKKVEQDERRLKVINFEFTGEPFEKMMKLSNNSDLRLHIILMAGLVGLLAKYTGNNDIIVVVPIMKQEKEGDFINTVLMIRSLLWKNPTFKEMLLDLGKTMAEAYQNANYPLETLLYQLNTPYTPRSDDFPLSDIALLLTGIHDKKELDPLQLNIIFSFSKGETSIAGELEYNTQRYDGTTIERIVTYYRRFLATVLADIDTKPADIDILSDEEKEKLLTGFNNTLAQYPRDKTIHGLYQEQVERTPDLTAVTCEDNDKPCMTYRELNEKADRLACCLREKGLGPDRAAALVIHRSLDMIIGILGILKAGGGYLPIDPNHPEERINYILKDSGVKIVVSDRNDAGTGQNNTTPDFPYFPTSQPHHVHLFAEGVRISLEAPRAAGPKSAISPTSTLTSTSQVGPANLAYIIYTSGTTGIPKGVMIEHRNVVSLMCGDRMPFDFNPTEVWTMFHSYCFDFSVWEMYGALLYGGKLLVIPGKVAKDPAAFLHVLTKEAVTVLNQTPSAFYNLSQEEIRTGEGKLKVKYVIFGGEALNPSKLKEWKSRYPLCRLINMYGITETTVHVTYKEITYDDIERNSSGIGVPIPTLKAYIMDKTGRLSPPGVSGEIWIGGEGVARGYLNRPGLTREKFMENPYKPGERLYRSGDLSQKRGDGELEYIGRIDNQVKIRAHRIELGELENQLLKFTPVKDAAVAIYEDRDGERQLVAYAVPHPRYCSTICRLLSLENQGRLNHHPYYDLPNGMAVFYLNRSETDFMYREIFEKRSYFKYGITLEEDACVFDVGANIGIFALYVNSQVKNAKIFAFEPIPPTFEVLALNASIYGPDSEIEVFQCGLSDMSGEANFTYYPYAAVLSGQFANKGEEMKNVHAFLRHQPAIEQPQQDINGGRLDEMLKNRLTTVNFSCCIKTLSRVIREKAIREIDLLKIDVEKGETGVLRGIEEEHWPLIRQIVIEVHNVDGRLESIRRMLALHGYHVEIEQEEELQGTDLYNIFARQSRIGGGAGKAAAPLAETGLSWSSPGQLVQDLRVFLKNRLPDHMIPSHFVLLERLPVTANGKVDRKALPEPRLKSTGNYEAPQNQIEQKLVKIWAEVLHADPAVIGRDSNFVDLGGHSLKAVQLVSKMIKDFDVTISKIFEYPTIAELAANISEKKDHLKEKFNVLKEAYLSRKNHFPMNPLEEGLKQEYGEYRAKLETEPIVTRTNPYKNILLTGATGYLGAHLIAQLLENTGATLFLLVRGSTLEEAKKRLRENLVFYFGEDFYLQNFHRWEVQKGDLTEENLGINPAEYRKLSEILDAIIHGAANVSHFGRYEDFHRTNVEGTERMLEFALTGKEKDFHYMSTITIGLFPVLRETLFTEYYCDLGQTYDQVYRRSKFEAEKKVIAYREKGLNAQVYRLGNHSFHSKTGKFQRNIESNAFYARMKAYITLGVAPEIESFTLGHVSFVDYLARAVILLMTQLHTRNETFHVYNNLDMWVKDLANFFKKEKSGIEIKAITVEKFLDFLELAIDDKNKRSLVERLLLHSGIYDTFGINMRSARTVPVNDRTVRILKKLGFEWHMLTGEHMEKMFMYCRDVGFIDRM